MTCESVTILGGKGMLGSDLHRVAAERGMAVQIYDLPAFDITNRHHIGDVVRRSRVIINCAAYTNVEKAETESELANQVNGYAVGVLGEFAAKANVPVVHVSTDFVFDGQNENPYIETDIVNPVSVYGSSKLLGEELLIQSGCMNAILRVQWTYGRHGVNFITKITSAARITHELKVVDDQIGSPTHTEEVAKVICDMLEMQTFPEGIYHCAATGYTSRYQMTRYLLGQIGIQKKVLPCKTSDFKTAAQRPLNSRFNCSKLQKLLSYQLPTWQTMLDNYINKIT